MKEVILFLFNFIMGIASGLYLIYLFADLLTYSISDMISFENRLMNEVLTIHEFIDKQIGRLIEVSKKHCPSVINNSLYTPNSINKKFIEDHLDTIRKNGSIIDGIRILKIVLTVLSMIFFAGGMAYKIPIYTYIGVMSLLTASELSYQNLFTRIDTINIQIRSTSLTAYNFIIGMYTILSIILIGITGILLANNTISLPNVLQIIAGLALVLLIINLIRQYFLEKLYRRNIIAFMYHSGINSILAKDVKWASNIVMMTILNKLNTPEFRNPSIYHNLLNTICYRNKSLVHYSNGISDFSLITEVLGFLSVVKLDACKIFRKRCSFDEFALTEYKIHSRDMLNQIESNVDVLCKMVEDYIKTQEEI